MWVSLVSLFLDFREEHCLSPDLSSLRVGMQNQTLFGSGFHASIGDVGGTAWRQIGLLLGFLRVWLYSDKLFYVVSNRISLAFLHSDPQSGLVFNLLGRYSAVIVI